MNALDIDTIKDLLKEDNVRGQSNATPQVGPLRYSEKDRRCASRGCGTMTHYTVQGAPKCSVHALEELNNMLYSAGFKGVVTSHNTNPTELNESRILSATIQYKLDIGWALNRCECIHGIRLDKSCQVCNGEISGSNTDTASSAARINA